MVPLDNAFPELDRDLRFYLVENRSPRRLTREQIDQYNEVGFIFPLDVFSDDEARVHREYFDDLMQRAEAAEDMVQKYQDQLRRMTAEVESAHAAASTA